MKKATYVNLSIAIIIIIALLRFIFALTHTVSGDACWHLSASRFIATENSIPLFEGIGRLQPFWAPPLFHFVAAFFYKIATPISINLADLSLKLVSPIFATLTIILLFLLTRRLFDEKIAFYSMVFINFIPLFLDYSIFSYVGSTTTFFSLLSIYLMLNNRYFLASTSLGLAMLTKYNAIFVYPMLLYLAYKIVKEKKLPNVKLAIVAIIPFIISSLWLIRNFILLKNPFWPFLNEVFNGIEKGIVFSEINLANLLSLKTYFSSYLEIFGIPNGNFALLSFYDIPFLGLLFFIWIIATMIFIFPFIKGLLQKTASKRDERIFLKSIYILFASYLVMMLLYIVNVGWFGTRLLLPIIPFIAIIWAQGLDSIKIKKIYLVILLLIGTGFIITQGIKLTIASNQWDFYEQDFKWVTKNTPNDATLYGNGQCLPYNINRPVINHRTDLDPEQVDYVWVNNKWNVDFKMNSNSLTAIENSDKLKQIYNNPQTGTVIYETTR